MESRGRKIQGLWLLHAQSSTFHKHSHYGIVFNLTHAQQTASRLLVSDSVLKS